MIQFKYALFCLPDSSNYVNYLCWSLIFCEKNSITKSSISLDNFEKLWILDQCVVPVISGEASPVPTKYLNSIMEAAIETIAPDDAHCAQSPAGMLLIIRPFCSISFAFALASPFLLQGKYSEMLLPMISKIFELSYY